ncbi:sterol regulatory element-binding protein cleavage-activating protein isoform X1 [Frankliniella occidentalis]|uniref:Sterol regulatory element-binding protein cleavage-activating protein n=1 Tax=Frankliniella occidentalis TaxID=133901 RepID=A0A6J1SVB3_FRAOC|nr:sterol regulatory element-binding protein cleavage-activating protein isoform X1 [Frankliniella occidentalis]
MAPARVREGPSSKSLPERVGQLYYAYGLFCASHPVAFLLFASAIVTLCCYPLVNLPLPGNVPQPYASYTSNQSGYEGGPTPVWYSGAPVCYIQQIVIKTAVSPWNDKLVLTDAFRGPLSEVFALLETIRNYEDVNSSRSLSHICLHVEAVKSRYTSESIHILPEYNCLVLSPANLWHQSYQEFQEDSSLLGTIFNYVNLQRSKISLAEISFGLNLKDTGIKRYPMRTRQRTLQYAITLLLQENDKLYINGLRKRLTTMFPLHQDSIVEDDDGPELHIYYPGEFNWKQLIPLMSLYFMFFLWVYFSVRKVDTIRSKIGFSICTVITILASLLMSIGVCSFFGHMLTINSREVYPYLAMVVGVENIFVLSKAMLHTPRDLDLKIRVAQGLSKEGWSITYNLLTEVTILTFGLFTFVPAIQRFCIFAVVGLLCDFFMQLAFFTSLLTVVSTTLGSGKYRHSVMQTPSTGSSFGSILRSKSHPRLNGIISQSTDRFPTIVVAPVHYAGQVLNKLPKRIQIVHFWANTRFVQRSFMVFMVSWIAFIAYNSDVLESFFQLDATDREWEKAAGSSSWQYEQNPQQYLATSAPVIDKQNISSFAHGFGEEDMNRLKPNRYDPWDRLSPYHWPTILSLYNVSVSGRYLSVLPAIRLSYVISPEVAVDLRNPNERPVQHFHWQTLAAALDPLDFSDGDQRSSGSSLDSIRGRKITELPLLPSSPMELFFLCLLCVVSVGVLAYCMVLLYRCVCSRNYAEWRSGWVNDPESTGSTDAHTEVVLEAIPLVLEGHPQEVECIASDGSIVVSTCLAGQIYAWDSVSGETLASVDRKRYFAMRDQHNGDLEESLLSDQEADLASQENNFANPMHQALHQRNTSGKDRRGSYSNGIIRTSNRSGDWSFPDLRSSINTNFSSLTSSSHSPSLEDSRSGYDFSSKYRELFQFHRRSCDLSGSTLDSEETHEDCSCGSLGSSPPKSLKSPQFYLDEFTTRKSSFESQNKSGRCDGANANVPPIWCIDCRENIVVLGCANGRLEFWEGASGRFKCLYEDPNLSGVTAVKLVGNRVVAARLSGFLDFLVLESYSKGRPIDWGFTAYRRTHVRSGSAGSLDWDAMVSRGEEEDIRCVRLHSTRAHQQPITVLQTEGGRVLTGSQDHTLKVFRLEDYLPLYTLHGHCGPITCLFIDCISPMTAGSGSQDGLLCVWDLLTGACMYSIQAHDGAILALTYSASYVISLGADDRLCVWERFQGHLLNTIWMVGLPHVGKAQAYCSSIAMLTHSLLVTSKQGSLIVWDVRAGDPVRLVRLGHADSCVFVKQLLLLRDSVVCDYANQLRIVRFPLATDKTE